MSLIIKKYDYPTIERVEVNGKRRYAVPGAGPVPSVTTVLDATSDKSHLIEWRKRVGEDKAAAITKEASGVGSRMHHYLETYVETGEFPSPGSNPYAIKANEMAKQIVDNGLCHVDEIWGSEVNLYIPNLYAGTTDLVGTYRGKPAIIDFKQSNKPKKKEWIENYFLQISLYIEAHNDMFSTDIQEGHILMCSRDLTYQHFYIEPDDWTSWRKRALERLEKFYSL